MTTSPPEAAPRAAGLGLIPALLSFVRFSHTIFALPFALASAVLARLEVPAAATLGWILLAMVGARTLAMALNRVIDADIDAANPRTASRELPSGRLALGQVAGLCAVSLAMLLVAVSQLPEETWVLWPVPVAAFVLYPLAKRVTWACHLALGLTIGIAPMGAWLAVTGDLGAAPVMLGLGVALWIAGFDIIYALLDVDFDRSHGVHSVPARFGEARALWVTRGLHAGAIALLAAAGAAAGAGWWYAVGVALCALVLLYENAIVRPGDTRRVQAAFAQSNGLLAVVFLAFTLADVTL
ncbi:UbiA-like polyprenyltransferase [Miltoncostaea oceani]|uniref:UbiA-like polyprenyltransferase n=1 Tax=Miltoncostaea oceani TaxID=2843216 RepID=UPI001C3D8E9E|nr:UbiA-like polyprenyltransferase [Miltoncostaea oceani]